MVCIRRDSNRKVVNVPLVLHGGSGNPDKEIGEAAKLGINKINISSDIKDALYQKLTFSGSGFWQGFTSVTYSTGPSPS